MKINFAQYCKENDIKSFSRTRGGWFKEIERFDESARGGYAFVGSNFIKIGNFDSIIPNGLYIDCSKHLVNDSVKEVINIFEITSTEVKLLQTGNKGSKWSYNFYDTVKEYFNNHTDDNKVQEILDAIHHITTDKEVIANAFTEELQNNEFANKYEVKMLLQKHNIAEYPFMIDEYIKEEQKILTRKDIQYNGGFAISDNDCNRIGYIANEMCNIDLKRAKIIAEKIEPYKIRTQGFYDNLNKIGDDTYCINNKRTNRNGVENRNNLLFVTCDEQSNTIFVKYCDIWCDWMSYW